MRTFLLTLVLLIGAPTIQAAPELGLSMGPHAGFDITELTFSHAAGAETLYLDDGVARSENLEAFLASRPRQPKGFQVEIEVDTARCSKLVEASRADRPLGRSIVRFSEGSSIHQFVVRDAKLGSVRCTNGSASIEIIGSRITYDGNVPK